MNKLLFSEGGQPLHLDDLNFMQESCQEALQALLQATGNCILHGVDLNPQGFITVYKGAIYYEGKLYTVQQHDFGDSQTAGYTLEHVRWDFRELREEIKTFEDGQDKATRVRYEAVPFLSKTSERGVAHKDLPYLKDRLSFAQPTTKVSLASSELQLVDYSILGKHSAMLTLKVDRDLKFDEILGNIEVSVLVDNGFVESKARNVYGELRLPRSVLKRSEQVLLEVQGSKLYLRRGADVSGSVDKVSFAGVRCISLIINWDYDYYWEEEYLDGEI